MYVASGASRTSSPSSTSWWTMYANTGLLNDAASNTVSLSTASLDSALRTPKPWAQRTPSFDASAMESPSTADSSSSSGNPASRRRADSASASLSGVSPSAKAYGARVSKATASSVCFMETQCPERLDLRCIGAEWNAIDATQLLAILRTYGCGKKRGLASLRAAGRKRIRGFREPHLGGHTLVKALQERGRRPLSR